MKYTKLAASQFLSTHQIFLNISVSVSDLPFTSHMSPQCVAMSLICLLKLFIFDFPESNVRLHKSRNLRLVSEKREVIQSSNLVKVYHPIVTRIGIVGLKGQ